jgi:hypothetical protein
LFKGFCIILKLNLPTDTANETVGEILVLNSVGSEPLRAALRSEYDMSEMTLKDFQSFGPNKKFILGEKKISEVKECDTESIIADIGSPSEPTIHSTDSMPFRRPQEHFGSGIAGIYLFFSLSLFLSFSLSLFLTYSLSLFSSFLLSLFPSFSLSLFLSFPLLLFISLFLFNKSSYFTAFLSTFFTVKQVLCPSTPNHPKIST